ncbi:hypothetical protein FGIG_02293 [Fasciola gigantica]|uniref:Uncharacterized protein n=1 Tax=Fasciola gigantica TaxID=46835 RepID=A0A504Z1L6_FASGI|nr:hypothetical protein FGIG_02293 [Fasciola gigantica]
MCKHRNSSQLSSAEITRTNKQQHPLPSLSCNGNTVFDFTDPNVSISAEAFLSALDSRSAGSSPHPCRSTPTTPTLCRSQMGSSVLSFTDTSDRGAASRLTTPTVNSFSLVPPGVMRSTIPESHPDVGLPISRPINSPSNRFDTKNAPEAVTCTCMPNGPVLCECAVQAVRIQRHLLRCRRQLFKETNRIQDLKVTIEAYRIALENQFRRNRSLSTELATLLNLVPYKACSGTLFEETTTTSELQKTTQHENTDVMCAELNPSAVFRNLLLWFHQNLDNVAVAVNRLNTPNSCTCGVSRQSYNRADKTFDRGSLDSLYGASGDAEYRKIGRSTSRHLPTGSGRRIARLRDSRSLTDLRLDVDEATIVKESSSTSPSGFPHSSSPERIRKRIQNLKVSHTLGAAAKVRSRARSVELIPVINSDGRDHSSGRQPSEEARSSLSVMSELVVKISELAEILAKQELIADITATAVSL